MALGVLAKAPVGGKMDIVARSMGAPATSNNFTLGFHTRRVESFEIAMLFPSEGSEKLSTIF